MPANERPDRAPAALDEPAALAALERRYAALSREQREALVELIRREWVAPAASESAATLAQAAQTGGARELASLHALLRRERPHLLEQALRHPIAWIALGDEALAPAPELDT